MQLRAAISVQVFVECAHFSEISAVVCCNAQASGRMHKAMRVVGLGGGVDMACMVLLV